MTALSPHDLEKQNFFSFLSQHLGLGFEVYQLAGDASARKYFRVVIGQESWVLMQWEAFESMEAYPFTNIATHLSKHKVRVPKIKASSPEEGLLLLEDLGDLTLERKFSENQSQEMSLDFYKQAIDQLILIHYPSTADKNNKCLAFQIAFDTDKFLWELNYAKKHLLEGINQLKLSTSALEALNKAFFEIASKLDQEDKFISHRDYHSRNLMIKLGKLRVIDFQDARLGPIQYDLVSLLNDSYVSLEPKIQKTLTDYYLEKRTQYIPEKMNREHFDEIFHLQSIQRCFKACGSFASFYMLRDDTRYLKYITPTLEKVTEALEYFPELNTFQQILVDSGTLEKEYMKL